MTADLDIWGDDYWRGLNLPGRRHHETMAKLRAADEAKAKHNPMNYQCQATWHPEPPTEGNT